MHLKRPDDIFIVSIHWGANWGYFLPQDQVHFAHRLIDEADVAVVFGHSSHHAKRIERYRHRLIFYGWGDFLNDYEGISGHEEDRGDLVFFYALDFDPSNGEPPKLDIKPVQKTR